MLVIHRAAAERLESAVEAANALSAAMNPRRETGKDIVRSFLCAGLLPTR